MKKFIILLLIGFFAGLSCSLKAQIQTENQYSGLAAYIQGIEAFENKEFETARSLLLESNRKIKDAPGINFALADTYLALDDLPNAALYGKQAVEADPANKWYRLKLAQIYRNAGRNDATLEELKTLLNFHPNDFDALYLLADTYKTYGEFIKSNQVLDEIIKLQGPESQILFMKFRNYESLALADSAISQLERIRELDPGNLEMLNLLGQYYARTGSPSQAKLVLRDALIRNARDPQTLINLAGMYLDEQKWDSAGTLLTNFISDSLNKEEIKMDIARFMYSRAQSEPQNIQLRIETERVMDAFTKYEMEYGPAFTISGEFYAQIGQPDKALKNLKRANELLPQDDIAWRQRLQLLLSENKYDEAVEVGKKANEMVPDDSFIQFFVGSAYMLSDKNEKAEQWLENAVRAPARRPLKSVIYSTLGDVRANLEKHEASDEAYELALRYDPDNDNAMNNYAYFLSLRGENLDRAKELALKAIEIAPENAAYLDTAGWVYFKLEDYDRARRYIRAAIDTGAASAEVLEHLGDVYEQLGNMDEAKKWWEQALENEPERKHLQNKLN